jgi:hypothetical protein
MNEGIWLLIPIGLLFGCGAYKIGFTTWKWYVRYGVALIILAYALVESLRHMFWVDWVIWSFGAVLLLLAIWRPKWPGPVSSD